MAGEAHAAARRREVAGEAVEEGRLAGAVGADEADDLARSDGEVGLRQREEAAEAAADLARLKQHGALP